MEKHRRRRRRRRASLAGCLLPIPAILLIGVILAAALSPHTAPAGSALEDRTEGLADQLANSLTSDGALPVSVQKGSLPPPAPPGWVVQDLLPVNDCSRPGTKLDGVNGVVVHYTGNPGTTAEQNRSYFANLAETRETYASSHFVIGIDGTVIQCVPLDEVAYCSSQRNSDTISIECCHEDAGGEFSQSTLDSLYQLLDWLIETYSLDRAGILRHYDVTGKECPYYYVKHPDAWETLLDALTF